MQLEEKTKPLIVNSVIKKQNQKLIFNNLQFVKRPHTIKIEKARIRD